MELKNKKDNEKSIFNSWIVNNRFSIFVLNTLLLFLTIFIFNKIAFLLTPVLTFVNAIMPAVILAGVQYYLMNPIVDCLEQKYRIPRIVTILALFMVVLIILILIVNTLLPVIEAQTKSLIDHWPSYWDSGQEALRHLLHDPRLDGIRSDLNDAVSNAQSILFNTGKASFNLFLENLFGAVNVISMLIVTLLTAPFILFFMLKDGKKINPYLTSFMPPRLQNVFSKLLHDINIAVSSYVRGQLIVAFWVGVMFAVGYTTIGLKYGLTLAILAACLNLIPYFGTLISLIPAIIIGILDSPVMLLKIFVVFFIEQLIEGRFISPLVMGSKMKMNPVTTILLLIGANSVAGLLGVIFAIPIYAGIKIIVVQVFDYYRKNSSLYK
ncbi:MAG: AI-2E family transporter [Lactobacillus iners]|nr:AI-2E family transporter [Lactobacillus iners]